jgi:hypothetical protein
MRKKLILSGILLSGILLLAASVSLTAAEVSPQMVNSSPGHQVGITHYDYQTSGSTGNRIVKDPLGGIHVCWTNAPERYNRQRHVYYNFRDESGNWSWTGGVQVSVFNGSGFTTLDLLSDNRAVPVYHNVDAGLFLIAAKDAGRGFGNFTEYYPPDYIPDIGFFGWPFVAVDGQNRIHLVATEVQFMPTGPMDLMYTCSSDGGVNWTDPLGFDSTMVYGHNIVASPVDDKVAIVYNRPFIEDPTQAENEVYYLESEDGINWNWQNKINITNYEFDNDTLVAYTDNDAVYDNQGDLHIVWNASFVNRFGWINNHAYLFHWSQATGISMIANHSQWKFPKCSPGSWNLSYAKMSLGVDVDNNLFLVYTRFDSSDCSDGNYANGDLWMVASSDGGASWGLPVNITRSRTPGCLTGDCDSDVWSSLAEVVDDSLHILFINDKDAGGAPNGEGRDTENPVLYLAYPNPFLYPPPAVKIKVAPRNRPVVIPPEGGWVSYWGGVHNQEAETQTVDVWTKAHLPDGSYFGPVHLLEGLVVAPNDTIRVRTVRDYVPGMAPAGYYDYIAYVGEYPWVVLDSSYFSFAKQPGGEEGSGPVIIPGEDRVEPTEEAIPSSFGLAGNYPNPFNASTIVAYALSEPGRVRLEVYNIKGQRVAMLVDSYQETGYREVTWDASGVSSGIYLCKLSVGDLSEVRRMILVK